MISEAQVAHARAVQTGSMYVDDLLEYPVDRRPPSSSAPVRAAATRCCRSAVEGDQILVAMVDPGDIFAIDDVRVESGCAVRPSSPTAPTCSRRSTAPTAPTKSCTT